MKKLFLALSILFFSCSNPQTCPSLDYDVENQLTFSEGKRYTGRCTVFNDTEIRSIQQYLDGVDYGRWIFYYPNGNTETVGRFKGGVRVGTWKYYYSNGVLKQVSKYSQKGIRKGTWREYDSLGGLLNSVKY